MKIVIMEPLDVENSYITHLAEQRLPRDTELVIYDARADSDATLIERGRDAEVIVIANQSISDAVIRGWEKLQLLDVAFTGTDHVNVGLCGERGVTVCNCAGYSTEAVADIVFGMVIDLLRNIIPCDRALRQGGTGAGLVGCELAGKTFGVVGTGAIGSRVARIAGAFGCRVLAYSRSVRPELEVSYVPLERLMEESDIVSVHVPVSDDTRGIISRELLARMKKTAYLINTARGPVVDTQALADALRSGAIAGAGVDVFDTEPPIPSDNPLLSAPNTVLTPHIAFASREAFVKRANIVFENIVKWQSGVPQNVVCACGAEPEQSACIFPMGDVK